MNRQSGFTLVEVLIGSVLIGAIALLGLKFMQKTDNLKKKFEDRYRLDAIGYDIKREVDCSKAPRVCGAGSFLTLTAKDGSILIAADKSTQKNGWNFAAQCVSQNRFEVRVAKLDGKNKFLNDPITKQALDWQHPQSVIFPAGTLCSLSSKRLVTVDENVNVVAGEGCLVSSAAELPCNPPSPPNCNPGAISTGLTIDTFGGGDGNLTRPLYGQRWLRYCAKQK